MRGDEPSRPVAPPADGISSPSSPASYPTSPSPACALRAAELRDRLGSPSLHSPPFSTGRAASGGGPWSSAGMSVHHSTFVEVLGKSAKNASNQLAGLDLDR